MENTENFIIPYASYVEAELPEGAPSVSVDRLRSLLQQCPSHPKADQDLRAFGCSGCDQQFFSCISEELASGTEYFNKKVQWLLRVDHSSILKKALLKMKYKQARSVIDMVGEGHKLLKYGCMMSLAVRDLLEIYDQIHASSEGAKFKEKIMHRHMEPIQSPWLKELLAFYFNSKLKYPKLQFPELCPGCTCDANSEDKLRLTCIPHESIAVDFELVCSVCLENYFQPMALKCGHVFCYSCSCTTASVKMFEGLKKVNGKIKCPLCREANVFDSAIHLSELELLIYNRCKDEWKDRLKRERKERMRQIKDRWSFRPEDLETPIFRFINY